MRRLENVNDRTDSRILLIDGSEGQILADTGGNLAGQNLFTPARPSGSTIR